MKKMMTPIKIAIVDDHPAYRKGLIYLVNAVNNNYKYEILFEAKNGNDMISKIEEYSEPDIIFLDVDMPGLDGYETVNWLKEYYPAVKILVISVFEKEDVILKMIRLKVNGYLSKIIEIEEMQIALEDIVQKGSYYSDFVSRIMAEEISKKEATDSINTKELTSNLRTFIQLAATDMTYKQIAEKMHLSVKTIEGYRDKLFKLFKIRNRAALVSYANKNKLL
jgi:DNA-binding NarL/FixJ family response regulator